MAYKSGLPTAASAGGHLPVIRVIASRHQQPYNRTASISGVRPLACHHHDGSSTRARVQGGLGGRVYRPDGYRHGG
eukprot:6963418-Pyramimonas_sp.AAC.1